MNGFTKISGSFATGQYGNEGRIFDSPENRVTASCMDYRIRPDGRKVRYPGLNIHKADEIESFAKILKNAGVTVVESHDDCGAARLGYIHDCRCLELPQDNTVKQKDVDTYAKKYACKLADIMSESGKEVTAVHITKKQLEEYHEKFPGNPCDIYVFRGQLPNKVPRGFIIGGADFTIDQFTESAEIAAAIAKREGASGIINVYVADNIKPLHSSEDLLHDRNIADCIATIAKKPEYAGNMSVKKIIAPHTCVKEAYQVQPLDIHPHNEEVLNIENLWRQMLEPPQESNFNVQ